MDKHINKNQLVSKLLHNKRLVARIAAIALILIIALFTKLSSSKSTELEVDAIEAEADSKVSTSIFIDICGAVKLPGVYEVDSETRLFEVIEKAGGLEPDADLDSINQAEFVSDGQKIIIPSSSQPTTSITGPSSSTSSQSGLVNINTASKDELMTLSGIGEAIASRIIEYREQTRFQTIEDIMSVKGIGNAVYAKISDSITV